MSNNDDFLIKKLKSHFNESRSLSAPVIHALIQSLNNQDKYSPLLIDLLSDDGFEIITPKRQGLFIYEALARRPVISSIFGFVSLSMIGLYPVYGIPLISLVSGTTLASIYYQDYFRQSLDNGYCVIQRNKECIADFLRSLIELRKLISSFPDDLMPVDLKAKNISSSVSDLIETIGHSIFSNIENSNKIRIKDIVLCLRKIKALYVMGSHQELFFYESIRSAISKDSSISIEKQSHKPSIDNEGGLNLGSEPEFSVKEDAISEGIRLAKQLNKSGGSQKTKKKSSRNKISKRRTATPRTLEEKSFQNLSPANQEDKSQESKAESLEYLEKDHSTASNDSSTNTKIGIVNQENLKTEDRQDAPVRSLSDPALNVQNKDDEDLLDALNEMEQDDGFTPPRPSSLSSLKESEGFDDSDFDGLMEQLEKGE